MAGKAGFQDAAPTSEEIEAKIKEHRRKSTTRTLLILVSVLVIVAFAQMWLALRTYKDYEVRSSIEQGNKSASKFANLNGRILEYSNDGAVCSDKEGKLIWNCAFEMSTPQLHICNNYLTVYDKGGTDIYILQENGVLGQIETPLPIRTACIAEQGTVAVLLENELNYFVKLYDKKGKELASGEFYGEQGSIPVDIALSYDAKKLAVDLINITGGTVDSMITFYNFGDVGQNEINNNVGNYTYEDTLIPQIEYISDSVMLAAGDRSVRVFTGAQKPELTQEIEYEHDIDSFFYGTEQFGIVYANNDEEGTRHLAVYNTKGKQVMEKDFSMIYDNVEILSNGEVCVTNQYECEIYTLHGIKKFEHKFDKEIYKVLHDSGVNNYIFITEGATEEVRLK